MCFPFKDYEEMARLRVLSWREQYPNLKEPTLTHLEAMLADVPPRKCLHFGSLIIFYVRRS